MSSKFFMLFLLGFLCPHKSHQTKIEYEPLPVNSIIFNPERGFYIHTEVFSKTTYQSLDADTLISYRSANFSLILRVFYLEKFLISNISAEYLNNLMSDFSKIRSAGLKCIVRFAYNNDPSQTGLLDAKKEQMLIHINQLKSIFNANWDVILVVQTGLIGSWGEWYYTDNFGYPEPSSSDLKNRKEILNALLLALPKNRMIQIRTPFYKRKLFSSSKPLIKSQAFKETAISRVGHHNDCFLASDDDYGTYENKNIDYPYLSKETLYTPMGGETCNPNPPRSNCLTALSELKNFHWSYLNVAYHPDVINGFKKEKCYDTIFNELGYRFELVQAIFPDMVKKNKFFQIFITIKNNGFASLFNKRLVYLILRNTQTSREFSIRINSDPRFWQSNSLVKISEKLKLPKTLTKGNYSIFINLPDFNNLLSKRSEYSIKFANKDLWEEKTGFNSLKHTIIIY